MTEAVVVQTAYLGDVVLTTPLLTALSARHGPVDVVTTPEAQPLLETHPAVHRIIPWQKRGPAFGAAALVRIARVLRRERYDVAYLPHRSVRSGLAVRLAGIGRRVGFDDAPARWLYTERRPRVGGHETERLLALAGTAGTSTTSLVLTETDQRVAAAALKVAGIAGPFVVVAPGSAWATKRWPYYRELIARVAAVRPVAIIGGAMDAGLLPGAIVEDYPQRCVDLAGRLSLRESAAVLAQAQLAVTNDSAALHLAGAVGTPVLAVFGPTTPSLGFVPRGPRDAVVDLTLPCRPCTTHGSERCPLGHHRCMRDLSVAVVAERVLTMLARS